MSKPKLKSQNFFIQVYSIVKQIPQGRVATYGQIAKKLGTRDARRVGFALHANKDPAVPCHRVVNREGKLAENLKRVHLFISGQVQGVFFRACTQEQARKLNLAGWARNTSDGQVEAVFEGEEAALKKIISWCHRGPALAKVEKVKARWEKAEGLTGFEIRY